METEKSEKGARNESNRNIVDLLRSMSSVGMPRGKRKMGYSECFWLLETKVKTI